MNTDKQHLPLHGRSNGLTTYHCTCGWSTFEFNTETGAWSSYAEHYRSEVNEQPRIEGRVVDDGD